VAQGLKLTRIVGLVLGLVALLVLSSCEQPTETSHSAGSPAPPPRATDESRPPGDAAKVVRVVDGDTIHVEIGGAEATVRLIGMDTPETVAPDRPVGCFGHEASAFTTQLLSGKDVYLEKDVSETDR
jgi:micrococcal nuclease